MKEGWPGGGACRGGAPTPRRSPPQRRAAPRRRSRPPRPPRRVGGWVHGLATPHCLTAYSGGGGGRRRQRGGRVAAGRHPRGGTPAPGRRKQLAAHRAQRPRRAARPLFLRPHCAQTPLPVGGAQTAPSMIAGPWPSLDAVVGGRPCRRRGRPRGHPGRRWRRPPRARAAGAPGAATRPSQ